MENQGARLILYISKPNIKVFAIHTVSMMTLLIVFLATGLGSVNAAISKSPSVTAAVLDCGTVPICGYLKAHNSVQAHSSEVVTFECWLYPTCISYSMHFAGGTRRNNFDLSSVLAAQPQPGANDAQLVVTKSTLVRSGPGQLFYIFGELPVAFVSEVSGVNQFGDWLVIPLSLTVAPDGMGWVEVATVKTKNITPTLIDLSPCIHFGFCGYIQAHNWQNLPVLQPTYATEKLLGLSMIVDTGNK